VASSRAALSARQKAPDARASRARRPKSVEGAFIAGIVMRRRLRRKSGED
jgi:hypothetical protein